MLSKTYVAAYGIGSLAVSLLVLLILFPSEAFHASLKGVSIWWDVLFPALFPFFVISDFMLGVGIVHFFGTILDPLMRPVFRIPGIGGFVVAMGFAAGYPVGARLTSQLWDQQLVNREEGERLVAFTTSSDPIFLIGAVSIGFFHDPGLAGILAAAHYGSALLLGLLMRFHGKHRLVAASPVSSALAAPAGGLWARAFEAMHEARLKDRRSLGEILSQAVKSGLQLVFVIGGLVVFFAVVMEVLTSAHMMTILYAGINALLHWFGIAAELSEAVANGIFEVTLGAKAAGGAGAHISLMHKTAIAAFILSWAGLSVHAQIVSLLHQTNLRYLPFLAARLMHGLLAAAAVVLLWGPMQSSRGSVASLIPAMNPVSPIRLWYFAITWSAGAFIGLLILSLLFYGLHQTVKQCMKWLK